MNKNVKQVVLPITAAFIWGTSFVAQDIAAQFVKPFTFNFLRSAIAVVFLFIMVNCIDFYKKKSLKIAVKTDYKKLFLSGFVCGFCLFIATNLQQFSIDGGSESGKVAFITALYMVLVPIVGLFFKKKVQFFVWIALIFAVLGLYFLCVGDSFYIKKSDMFALVCAIAFTAHILLIDHYSANVDCIKLSLVQFLTVTVLSLIFSLVFEWGNIPSFFASRSCALCVLYVGLFSSGIAYTLQVISQKGTNPTIVSLFLSLESLFAVISAAIITHDRMGVKAYLGCAFMLAAVLLSQVKITKMKKGQE